MTLLRRGDELAADVRKPQGSFRGEAEQRTIHSCEGEDVRVSFVHFEPGSHTHWHSHSGGQVLHVTDGRGQVQSRGSEIEELGPGDTVVAAPAEEHWHGAAPGSTMTHLATTIGDVTWGDAPT